MLNCSSKEYEKVTAGLTNEEIVTRLLTANEVLKPKKGNFYISNPTLDTLGDFILDIETEYKEPLSIEAKDTKYIFIRQ